MRCLLLRSSGGGRSPLCPSGFGDVVGVFVVTGCFDFNFFNFGFCSRCGAKSERTKQGSCTPLFFTTLLQGFQTRGGS